MPWQQQHIYKMGEGMERRVVSNNPEYPRGAMWDLLNMVYDRDQEEPEKMGGSTQLGTTARGGRITGLFDYAEGTRLIACSSDGKISERAAADFSVASGGTGFNTGTDTRWNATMFYGATTAADLLILANGVDNPQKYTSGAGISALGGSPPTASKFPVGFMGRLWLAKGDTLSYSDVSDAEDFAGGGSIQVDRGSGAITGMYVFMGNLMVFKRRKVFRLLPTTRLSETSVREVSAMVGTVSNQTIREGKDSILFFENENGIGGIIPTSSTGGFRVIDSAEQIKKVLDRRSRGNQATAFGVYYEDRDEYWMQYGTATTTPTEGVICNASRGHRKLRWTRNNRPNLTAGTVYRASGAELHVVGDTSGNIYQMHSGDSWQGSIDYVGRIMTPAYTQGQMGYMKTYGRLFGDYEAKGNYNVTVKMQLGRIGLPSPAGSNSDLNDLGDGGGWGQGTWGIALWGGSVLSGGRHVRPHKVNRGSWVRYIIETVAKEEWFKVNGLVQDYVMGSAQIAA
jgi:hypothetical protein